MICFRDKTSSNIEQLASIFVKTCQDYKIPQILINSNLQLALKLKATGIHLTSTQFNEIKIAKKNNLFVIISCHSLDDILKAQNLGANMVTYSPIFLTPNKGTPKGIDNLKNIISQTKIPIIALGGIVNNEQINQIKSTKSYGFASIRYFIA